MTPFNDNLAWLNGAGNLTLGNGGDDAAGHATYGYAKNDVTLSVPASLLVSGTLPALTYATGDIPIRALVAATHKIAIPMPQSLQRAYSGSGSVSAPHGIMIKSVALYYRVNTSALTSFSTMAINYTPLVAAAALPTVVALTTTLAGNTLTNAANVYAAVSTVTTPAFFPGADYLFWAVATIVVPTDTCDLLGASWRVAYALN